MAEKRLAFCEPSVDLLRPYPPSPFQIKKSLASAGCERLFVLVECKEDTLSLRRGSSSDPLCHFLAKMPPVSPAVRKAAEGRHKGGREKEEEF